MWWKWGRGIVWEGRDPIPSQLEGLMEHCKLLRSSASNDLPEIFMSRKYIWSDIFQ